MRIALACLPLLAGCLDSDSDGRIAPLSEFNIMGSVSDYARITFEHPGDNLDSNQCLILADDVTATLGDRTFTVNSRGGTSGSSCVFPEMVLSEVPTDPNARLTIGGQSCALGDTLVPFTMSRDAGDWNLVAGETVTIRVDKPADSGRLFARFAHLPGSATLAGPTAAGATTIDVTIPLNASGEYTLVVTASHDETISEAQRCGGLVFTSHYAKQAITVTAP